MLVSVKNIAAFPLQELFSRNSGLSPGTKMSCVATARRLLILLEDNAWNSVKSNTNLLPVPLKLTNVDILCLICLICSKTKWQFKEV